MHNQTAMQRGLCASTALLVLSLGSLSACGSDPAPCDGPDGTICPWAGDGDAAFDGDGHALLESSFYWPTDVTVRADGATWILDWNNHRVRRVVDGKLRTDIGTDFIGDGPDDQSDLTAAGAAGTEVLLNHPTQLVPNADGTLTLVSWHNHKLRKFDPATGKVWVICGRGAGYEGDGGPMDKALLNQPQAMDWMADGSMVILDQRNQVVRRIAPDKTISTIAGTAGEPGFGGDGGDALKAKFNLPTGSNPPPGGWIAAAKDGAIYISDTLNNRIRKVSAPKAGVRTITTVAGNGKAGFSGDGGPASDATLNNPRNIRFGPDGRLYIADELNHRIRAVDLASGTIDTVVGSGDEGDSGDGGPALKARLNRPSSVAFLGDDMLVIDTYNHRIRRVLGGGKNP